MTEARNGRFSGFLRKAHATVKKLNLEVAKKGMLQYNKWEG